MHIPYLYIRLVHLERVSLKALHVAEAPLPFVRPHPYRLPQAIRWRVEQCEHTQPLRSVPNPLALLYRSSEAAKL